MPDQRPSAATILTFGFGRSEALFGISGRARAGGRRSAASPLLAGLTTLFRVFVHDPLGGSPD